MALRADTARHIITGATVLVFSAAAIGTAMRYQDRGPIAPVGTGADLLARPSEPTPTPMGSPAPVRYTDGAPNIAGDIDAQLDSVLVHVHGGGAVAWPFRESGAAGTLGTAAWWGSPAAHLTPTSGRRRGGVGPVGMPGGGHSVSGGVRGPATAAGGMPPAPRMAGPSSGAGSSSGGGGTSSSPGGSPSDTSTSASASTPDPVFGEHSPSVGDLLDNPVDGDDGLGALPESGDPGFGPGDLSSTPEPTSLLLMATGLAAGVLQAARRRRRQARPQ